MTTIVMMLLRSNSISSGFCSISATTARLEQLQPAEQEVSAEGHDRVGGQIRPVGEPLVPGQADLDPSAR